MEFLFKVLAVTFSVIFILTKDLNKSILNIFLETDTIAQINYISFICFVFTIIIFLIIKRKIIFKKNIILSSNVDNLDGNIILFKIMPIFVVTFFAAWVEFKNNSYILFGQKSGDILFLLFIAIVLIYIYLFVGFIFKKYK